MKPPNLRCTQRVNECTFKVGTKNLTISDYSSGKRKDTRFTIEKWACEKLLQIAEETDLRVIYHDRPGRREIGIERTKRVIKLSKQIRIQINIELSRISKNALHDLSLTDFQFLCRETKPINVLSEIFTDLHMHYIDAHKLTGISPQNFTKWIGGRSRMSPEMVELIYNTLIKLMRKKAK